MIKWCNLESISRHYQYVEINRQKCPYVVFMGLRFFWKTVDSKLKFVGLRGVITLCNKLNLAAEFTWTPILGERGTAFSIRPATGRVADKYDTLFIDKFISF